MKIKLKEIALVILVLLCCCISIDLLAQGPPSSGTNAPPCWPPPCIPIDGGISFLILAGIALGGKKAYDYSKKAV